MAKQQYAKEFSLADLEASIRDAKRLGAKHVVIYHNCQTLTVSGTTVTVPVGGTKGEPALVLLP